MGKGQLGGAPSWFKKITDKIRRDISNSQGQNLITYPYYESSKTENGVQFSIRSDGSIKVNGHATADAYFKLHSHLMRDGNLTVPFGIYTLSGAPKGGNPQTCFMQVTMSIAGSECGIITDYGNGGIGDIDDGGDYITSTDAYIGIKICVKSGTTVPDLIFRPMLEKGTASHEYQPTNLTNKTLKNILSGLGNVGNAIADAKKAGTDAQTAINNHAGNKNNPHAVTKAQVGLGNVGDFKAVSTVANQGLTVTEKSNARANIGAGTSSFSGYYRDLMGTPTIPTEISQLANDVGYLTETSQVIRDAKNHASNKNNPHAVTKAQVGLDNVENKSSATIRGELTSSNVTTALGYTPINPIAKGANNGIAELDSNGKVPSSQLPSFVDDVIEGYLYNGKFYKETAHTTEIVGESGKIYIDLSTEKTYRWSGSTFVVISDTLALGETSSTAYRGDRGSVAYYHSQTAHARTDATKVEASTTNGNIKINGTETNVYTHPSGTNPHGTTKSDVGLGNVGNFKAVSTVADQGLTITEKSNARANIGAGTSSFSGYYDDLRGKPTIPTELSQLANDVGYLSNTSQVIKDTKNHISNKNNPHAVTASQIKAVSTVADQGLTDTEKSNARTNIGAANIVSTVTAGSFDPVNNTGGTYLKVNEALSTAASKIASISSVLDPLKTNVELFMDDITGHMGTTDISEIGDGTVTGGLNELNSNLDTLEFGEVAGGKNICDFDALISKMGYYGNFTKQSDGSYLFTVNQVLFDKGFVIDNISENEQYTFSLKVKCGTGTIFRFAIVYTDGTNTTSNSAITSDFTFTMATSEEGKIISYLRFDWSTAGTFYIKDFQVEEGSVATEYEPYIPSVKILAEEVSAQNESLSVIGKCKNLINATVETATSKGITFTKNGDGTYTVNGTATGQAYFYLATVLYDIGKTYKLVGCPEGGSTEYNRGYFLSAISSDEQDFVAIDGGEGVSFKPEEYSCNIRLYVNNGTTCNNLVFKPMLTTNLNATYDDFVPYTGDGETLTADVAVLKNDLTELDETVSNINGSNLKTSATKTASITSSISNSIASGTALDAAIQTLLNNDKTLDTKSDDVDNKSISTYDANVYYNYGNVVYYEGKVYRHIKVSSGGTPGVKGQVPTNTEYWKEITVSDLFKELSLASNVLSTLTSNDFDYSGGLIQIGAPPYTVNESLRAIASVLKQLNSNLINKIKIENITLASSVSFNSGTFKTYDIPSSKYEGYTGYLIKPIVDGDWADTYACVIAGKTSTKFGIRNIGTDTFSWNVSCTVIFIAN